MPTAPRQNPADAPPAQAPADDARDRGSVRSLLRALDLLEVLADTSDGLRLVEVAARADMPVSTVHRLLSTLEERRFARFDQDSRRWNVGAQALRVGAAFGRQRNFAGAATPTMQRLRDRSGQTVNLALAQSRRLTVVNQVAGMAPPPGLARVGAQSDIAATALGQAIIAALPQRQIAALLEETAAARVHAPLSLTLRETQARRYALDDEVNVSGLRCIAAPIFDECAAPIGAISVVGAARGRDVPGIAALGDLVMRAAAEVTGAIGGFLPRGAGPSPALG